MTKSAIIPLEKVEQAILLVRGEKVILDYDLARLYGVPTKVLNQSVKRNIQRFPSDFMFRLTKEEKAEVVTNCDHLKNLKFSPALPLAFTEYGVLMLANLINSQKAVEISVFIVRTFIRLRETLSSHKELTHKIFELEQKVASHDESIRSIVDAIRQLMAPPKPKKNQVGFHWQAKGQPKPPPGKPGKPPGRKKAPSGARL